MIDEIRGTAPVRALVVDDEPLALDRLRAALACVDGVELAGACASGAEAVTAIRDLAPDLVFLDVQMPGMDGFDVIEAVGVAAMPVVVFVTAYEEHALRAFEVHAADYLLKPFDDDRFAACVRHATIRARGRDAGALAPMLRSVLDELRDAPADGPARVPIARLLVRTRDRMHFINVEDVDCFEAAGNYVRLRVGESSHLIRFALADLEARLDPTWFVRIHRSTIVNVRRIREVQPWASGDYVAILHDGRTLRVSRTYSERLLRTAV